MPVALPRRARALSTSFALALCALFAMGCDTLPAPSGAAMDIECRLAAELSPSQVSTVSVQISGADFATLTLSLTRSGDLWRGTLPYVPAGTNRSARGEARDGAGTLLYAGSVDNITIEAGRPLALILVLQQVDGPPPFENHAPVIDAVVASRRTVPPLGSVALEARAHDPDDGDTLRYAWSSTTGSFAARSQPLTTWIAPATTGTAALTLEVRDQRDGAAQTSFDIAIESGSDGGIIVGVNTWPELNAVRSSLGIVLAGDTTSLTAEASDADGDPLAFAWTSDCGGSFGAPDAASTSFTLTANAVNPTCTLAVRVTDGRGGIAMGQVIVSTREPPIVVGDAGVDAGGPSGDAGPGDTCSESLCPAGFLVGPLDPLLNVERFCRQKDDPLFACGARDCTGEFSHATGPTCADGVCGHEACDAHYADCDGQSANGCEANLRTKEHCTGCDVTCGAGQSCTASGCGSCVPPLVDCTGTCANLGSDPEHCGACGHACAPEQTCSLGVCTGNAAPVNRCGSALTQCGSGPTDCANLQTDADNCGECGKRCVSPGVGLRACVEGVCRPCAEGFTLEGGQCVPSEAPEPLPDGTFVAAATGAFDVDESSIYSIVGTLIVRTPRAGGVQETFVADAIKPTDVAVAGEHVYWSDGLGHAIFRKPRAGGASQLVVSTELNPVMIAVNATTVYFVEGDGANNAWGVPRDGGALHLYDHFTGFYYALTADDSFGVWSAWRNFHYPGMVVQTATGAVSTPSLGRVYLGDPETIVASQVVVRNLEDPLEAAVYLVPRAEFPRSPKSGETLFLAAYGAPLALSEQHVYAGGVRVPRCGGAPRTFDGASATQFVIRDGYLYYDRPDGVARRPL